MALINRKFTNTKGVPKNFGSNENKIQKKQRSLLFPDLQETTDASVVVEFMKIKLSNLGRLGKGGARKECRWGKC
jgi:hypothetical protein